jgi:hypothetical protein
MQRMSCRSCGGVVAKAGTTGYRCVFCGTAFELERTDGEPVRALLEENNQRWLRMNRDMERFAEVINRVAGHPRLNWRGVVLFGGFFLVVLLLLGYHFHQNFWGTARPVTPQDLIPFLVFAGIPLVATAAFVLKDAYHRRMRGKILDEARRIAAGVLATYREMSDRPAGDLLRSLHNRSRYRDENTESFALALYEEMADRR